DKEVRAERMLELQHGEPLLFGANKDKGIAFDQNFQPQVVTGADLGKAFVWDECSPSPAPAMALATMDEAHFPVPIGVFRRQEKPAFERGVMAQIEKAKAQKPADLKSLLYAGEIWDVQ
ncbi:MAG: 2-oxoacid:ferredoxin oxidoreductase subunit beta, partial [Planctomycetota bacterium]